MISTLIKTVTASNAASIDFVDGTSDVVLDGTYDHYMFVMTAINPADDEVGFGFQVNATDDAGGGFDTSQMTTAIFAAYSPEGGTTPSLHYDDQSHDQANGTGFHNMTYYAGNDADAAVSGILHLFNPASTTYVKHFLCRVSGNYSGQAALDVQSAGYINDTTAIDEISFKMTAGNMDGVIDMYGIA